MPDAIGAVREAAGLGPLGPVERRPAQANEAGNEFRTLVGGLVDQVNRVQHDAAEAISEFASGDGENLHEVMLAVSKAELSFKFLMEARNKLVDAYHEVMRMQL